MNTMLQSYAKSLEKEINSGSNNDFDLRWARDFMAMLTKSINDRLGEKTEGHVVPDESIKQLDKDAEKVLDDVHEIEKESK